MIVSLGLFTSVGPSDVVRVELDEALRTLYLVMERYNLGEVTWVHSFVSPEWHHEFFLIGGDTPMYTIMQYTTVMNGRMVCRDPAVAHRLAEVVHIHYEHVATIAERGLRGIHHKPDVPRSARARNYKQLQLGSNFLRS